MYLEKQIKKVDNFLTAFEDQLAADTGLLDEPNAIRSHSRQLQVNALTQTHELNSKTLKTLIQTFEW